MYRKNASEAAEKWSRAVESSSYKWSKAVTDAAIGRPSRVGDGSGITVTVGKKRRLPAKCSSCGASVRPDEVSWVTPTSSPSGSKIEDAAVCGHCGSVLYLEQ